eukprot:m.32129 g.32129  ORF g.32129 m.32129 type:complete len:291 (-) comp12129_c0_seq2:35-907(-)
MLDSALTTLDNQSAHHLASKLELSPLIRQDELTQSLLTTSKPSATNCPPQQPPPPLAYAAHVSRYPNGSIEVVVDLQWLDQRQPRPNSALLLTIDSASQSRRKYFEHDGKTCLSLVLSGFTFSTVTLLLQLTTDRVTALYRLTTMELPGLDLPLVFCPRDTSWFTTAVVDSRDRSLLRQLQGQLERVGFVRAPSPTPSPREEYWIAGPGCLLADVWWKFPSADYDSATVYNATVHVWSALQGLVPAGASLKRLEPSVDNSRLHHVLSTAVDHKVWDDVATEQTIMAAILQ